MAEENKEKEGFEAEEVKDDLDKVSGGATLSCDGCDGCSEPGCADCSAIIDNPSNS